MRTYARLFAGSLLSGLFLFFLSPVVAHAGPPSGTFIDVDGDGFDDNLIDSDNNSIPDLFEVTADAGTTTILATVGTVATGIFSDQSGGSSVTISYKSHLEHFTSRLSGCLGLDKCRSDFESDFGSGIGFTLGAGGGCVGGVCF